MPNEKAGAFPDVGGSVFGAVKLNDGAAGFSDVLFLAGDSSSVCSRFFCESGAGAVDDAPPNEDDGSAGSSGFFCVPNALAKPKPVDAVDAGAGLFATPKKSGIGPDFLVVSSELEGAVGADAKKFDGGAGFSGAVGLVVAWVVVAASLAAKRTAPGAGSFIGVVVTAGSRRCRRDAEAAGLEVACDADLSGASEPRAAGASCERVDDVASPNW